MSVIYINSYQFAAPAGASDPYFSNVSLLLHGDGTNGSKTFVDSSSNNRTLTPAGSAQISTAQSKFGGASMLLDGAGNRLSLSSVLVNASATTFTAEAWIYMTTNPTNDANGISGLFGFDCQPTGNLNYFSFGPLSTRVLQARWFDGAAKIATGSTIIPLNQWTHIALVVSSNSIKMYVDGLAETLTGTTTLTARSGTTNLSSLGSNLYGAFKGYVDDLRISSVARYTSNFTPPTAPFPDA